MASVKVEVSGGEELERQLLSLDRKVANAAVRKALRVIGKKLSSEIKRGSPVESGDLQASVKVRSSKRKKGYIQMEVQIGEGLDHFYLAAQEYGSVNQIARPFIRPAVDQHGNDLLREGVEDIKKAIEDSH